MGPNNQYESALFNVGNVVEPYDLEKSFPVWGFGGIPLHIPGMSGVSHCFAINGQPLNPDIIGIQGIVDTYKSTLPQISLGSPRLFAPMLRDFKKSFINEIHGTLNYWKNERQYRILLILTDGEIDDMPETKALIADMDGIPCSIIIVGVGSCKFEGMQELYGFDTRPDAFYLSHDIVKFVAFNEAMGTGNLAE